LRNSFACENDMVLLVYKCFFTWGLNESGKNCLLGPSKMLKYFCLEIKLLMATFANRTHLLPHFLYISIKIHKSSVNALETIQIKFMNTFRWSAVTVK